MKIPIELPEIDGYEPTGEWRKAKLNEWFVNTLGEAERWTRSSPSDRQMIILRPLGE